MNTTLPTRTALKAQAKRLRARLADTGQTISHAAALEAIAHQYGLRDWNTLNAQASDTSPLRFAPMQQVSGLYLGHRFSGTIKSASTRANGHWALTIRFDAAIDVVTSQHFSNLRRQVNCVVDAQGRSAQKTSDAQPHVVLDLAQ